MASQSTHLGLVIPTDSDQFSTTDVANNWSTIDKYPGTYICTSTSRPNSGVGGAPTWTGANNGQRILETDTGLEWKWNGTQFVRVAGLGHLAGSANASLVSNSNAVTLVTCTQIANLGIPQGSRSLQIIMGWGKIQNTNGISAVALSIDGALFQTFAVSGDSSAPSQGAQGSAGNIIMFTTLASGLHTFTMGIRAVNLSPPAGGGTSTCIGATLDIIEL